MYRLFIIAACVLLLPFYSDGQIVLKEGFNYPDGAVPAHFWSEGCPAVVRNGRLFIDADTIKPRASSVWLDKELAGDLSIEFDVHVVSSSDDADNINLFFMYSDSSGRPLRESAAQRKDGLYRRDHEKSGYIFTNVTNGDSLHIRYRFRRNPGFKLIKEAKKSRKGREPEIHIKVLKKGNHIEYWENGNKIFDETMEGYQPYEKGLFGFRTWHTALEIDNLLIKRI